MGRKEKRRIKKLRDKSAPSLKPFIKDDTLVIPVKDEGGLSGPAAMTPQEFMNISHELSDKELNRIIYQRAQLAVEEGFMPQWPEDDFGTVLWFTWNFITPKMREAFPIIAKEYLEHYKDEELDDLLDFHRRLDEGEWRKEEEKSSPLTQKAMKAVGGLLSAPSKGAKPDDRKEERENTEENADIDKLKEQLEQKEAALAESGFDALPETDTSAQVRSEAFCSSRGWTKELNLVSWNGRMQKYDLINGE